MGIYDRDYYRRSGPNFLDSFSLRGRMTKWLIGINVAVFVLQILGRQGQDHSAITNVLVLIPDRVLSGEVWRLLSYAFVHDEHDIWHIVFNMWGLWLFAGYVEDLYGRWEFLAFYLLSAVVGGLGYMLQSHLSQIPLGPCMGASGAVMAVTILCAFHYPSLRIWLMFLIPLPIWVFAALLVVQDSFGLIGGGGRVAYSVHLAGAGFAALYYKSRWRLLTPWARLRDWARNRSRPRLRVYHGEDDSRSSVAMIEPSRPDIDEQLEAKVDAVLAKVARSGPESLSEKERQILLRASEVYKKKRT